jgi:hypothetical protein
MPKDDWICAHCSYQNGTLSYSCRSCGKEKEEKVFPRWLMFAPQRDEETDCRKFAEPFRDDCKYARKMEKEKAKREADKKKPLEERRREFWRDIEEG